MVMGGEKGYIQFDCRWEEAAPPEGPLVEELRRWRDRLYRRGLVGALPDGIGFGNLSCRTRRQRFLISGTATGGLPSLGPEHFTEVLDYDFVANSLTCRGPVRASSESLSHAAVYRGDPTARAVIHVHHSGLWRRLYGELPTSDPSAAAGTAEIARAIEALFRKGGVRDGVLVMGGHPDGLIAFGPSLDAAGTRLLAVHDRLAAC